MKHIALKAVSSTFTSAWYTERSRQYTIGKTEYFPLNAPAYLLTRFNLDYTWERAMNHAGLGGTYSEGSLRVVIVSVPEEHLTEWAPFYEGKYNVSGALSLEVLGEVDTEHFKTPNEALTFFEKYYNLPRVPLGH